MSTTTSVFNKALPNAENLILCDVTLRDGEVTPGVAFSQKDKIELTRRLDKIGLSQIQISFMNFSEEIKRSTAELCGLGLKMKTELMSNGMKDTRLSAIDFLMECGPDIVHSSFFITPYLNSAWGTANKAEMKKHITQVTEHIHKSGKEVNISYTDATRADPSELLEMVEHAAQAGAERIRMADTTGAISPEGMYDLVSRSVEVAGKYGSIIGVHCHNDFGLALANTLISIKAGAKLIDSSVNGLGDRTGNPAVAELGAALNFLYGGDCGLDMKAMTDLANFAAELAGTPNPVTKPLVGAFAFSHQQDLHIAEQIHQPIAFQCIRAEEVGNKMEIIFGKGSGVNSIKYKAAEKGVEIPESHYDAILKILAERADAEKGVVLVDKDFWEAVETVKKQRS